MRTRALHVPLAVATMRKGIARAKHTKSLYVHFCVCCYANFQCHHFSHIINEWADYATSKDRKEMTLTVGCFKPHQDL